MANGVSDVYTSVSQRNRLNHESFIFAMVFRLWVQTLSPFRSSMYKFAFLLKSFISTPHIHILFVLFFFLLPFEMLKRNLWITETHEISSHSLYMAALHRFGLPACISSHNINTFLFLCAQKKKNRESWKNNAENNNPRIEWIVYRVYLFGG